jgi:hypothetical protein
VVPASTVKATQVETRLLAVILAQDPVAAVEQVVLVAPDWTAWVEQVDLEWSAT